METAIIGAGVSGLSCAIELERHGRKAVVFERSSYVGEEYNHVGAALEVAHRPIKDAFKYISSAYGITLKPLNEVKSVVHHSPNKTTEIKGKLGYFIERSRGPNDVKIQLLSQLKHTPVKLNEDVDYEALSKKFENVVIATGTPGIASELGCWKDWLGTYVKGANILGEFDPNTMHVWINKDYCRNGYAYLTPFDTRRASLVLVVTEVSDREVDEYWDVFTYSEKLDYDVTQEFKYNHKSGYVYPHRVGNVFLTGNAGGMLDPFLGFGALGAVSSGVMAARSIIYGLDYEKQLESLVRQNLRMYELRKGFDLAGNGMYDLMISSIALPGLKQLIYHTPLNIVKLGSGILRLLPKGRDTR